MDKELDHIRNLELQLRNRESQIIEQQVGLMLMRLVGEVIEDAPKGKIPDVSMYSKQIVNYLREHLV